MPTVLFLGAGFSAAAGLPWGNELFEAVPIPPSRRRAMDVSAVLDAYQAWRASSPEAQPEQFVSAVYKDSTTVTLGGLGFLWPKLIWFLAYRLAAPQASVQFYGQRANRTRDNIAVASVHPVHKEWWNIVLKQVQNDIRLSVITTNWDILIERALRPTPTHRPWRPGFNYGCGPEGVVASSGFPGSKWLADLEIRGSVPLLKLHGSLNWAMKSGHLTKYGDLRPAFRGDAAIVPPVQEKVVPPWATDIWQQAREALSTADQVLVVGYSFPTYDSHVWDLFHDGLASSHAPVHVFDPNASAIRAQLECVLSETAITAHSGLPEALAELPVLIS